MQNKMAENNLHYANGETMAYTVYLSSRNVELTLNFSIYTQILTVR